MRPSPARLTQRADRRGARRARRSDREQPAAGRVVGADGAGDLPGVVRPLPLPGHEDATFVDSPLGPIPEGWDVDDARRRSRRTVRASSEARSKLGDDWCDTGAADRSSRSPGVDAGLRRVRDAGSLAITDAGDVVRTPTRCTFRDQRSVHRRALLGDRHDMSRATTRAHRHSIDERCALRSSTSSSRSTTTAQSTCTARAVKRVDGTALRSEIADSSSPRRRGSWRASRRGRTRCLAMSRLVERSRASSRRSATCSSPSSSPGRSMCRSWISTRWWNRWRESAGVHRGRAGRAPGAGAARGARVDRRRCVLRIARTRRHARSGLDPRRHPHAPPA